MLTAIKNSKKQSNRNRRKINLQRILKIRQYRYPITHSLKIKKKKKRRIKVYYRVLIVFLQPITKKMVEPIPNRNKQRFPAITSNQEIQVLYHKNPKIRLQTSSKPLAESIPLLEPLSLIRILQEGQYLGLNLAKQSLSHSVVIFRILL